MRRLILSLLIALAAPCVLASSAEGPKLLNANVDLSDKTGLQNGAKLFLNYCVSCHSASFMRYNRIAADLDIPEDQLKANLMFTTDKVGDPIKVAMRPEDAEQWFGINPPDLSVTARSRYLLSFYADPSRPTGVNNPYLPGAAMPHVLWELQGIKKAVYHTVKDEAGHESQVLSHLEPGTPGKLSEVDYQKEMRDLVAFMVYLGEPAKLVRYQLGVKVLLFLAVLLVAVYLMKREFWKDVH
jgi:ubiquinol-cytochrome c reductase cytochrome c1 subunit